MKKGKLLYVPGLISIIGLPVLLFFMGPEDRTYPTVIRLNLPSYRKDIAGLEAFTEGRFYRSVKGKKIVTVDMAEPFIGDPEYGEQADYLLDRKFHFITREVERMQFTYDTSMILKARLGRNNTYGDFVRLINHGLLYKMLKFVYIDDCVYYFSNTTPPEDREIELDPIDTTAFADINLPPPPSKWDLFKIRLRIQWTEMIGRTSFAIRHNYLLITGFLLLILLPGGIRLGKRLLASGTEQ